MPILGSKLYDELDQERNICITGSLSGGKTRLAFDIGLWYWRKGFRVFSNVPHNFVNWMGDGSYDLFRSYVVIDEGGEYVRQAKVGSVITRSAGKANYYAVFAGKRLPHKNLQDIIIRPRFDFYQAYGIPAILWKAKVNADEAYKFNFWQVFPARVHGTYSTKTSSGGIEDIFSARGSNCPKVGSNGRTGSRPNKLRRESVALPMISRKGSGLRFPEQTYTGRERVSLTPRWVTNWTITGIVSYMMFSYIARFLGFDTGWDPFSTKNALASPAVVTSTSLPDYPLAPAQSFYASSEGQVLLATQTALAGLVNGSAVTAVPAKAQIQPTYTPYPTNTPYPTQAAFFGKLLAVGYSYYWPPYGPPNCSADNWHEKENYCDDTTASGLRWSEYIGHAVAVPVIWREQIPLGSTIRVHQPIEMIGDYVVLDYCGSCVKPEGHIYFDFLDNRARLNWTVPMLVEVILQ